MINSIMHTLKDFKCISMILFLGAILPESMSEYIRVDPTMIKSDAGGNTIKICAMEMILVTKRVSENAFVKCYDKDPNHDDVMTEGFTGKDGCVTLKYPNKSWDWIGGRKPDIYCTVNKLGFVQSCPPDKDHHPQSEPADFGTVTLYRDRTGDYGHDNGCGPWWSEIFGINDLVAYGTGFKEQCTNHDKCYWDCKIFLAEGNAKAAQEFCDSEMYEGMKSNCHANTGDLPGFGELACLRVAKRIYQGLQVLGSKMAYDKSSKNCPMKDGKPAPSMRNDYSHNDCYGDGYGCGYDGTTHDKKKKCNSCCAGPKWAIHKGKVWDDYYCKCFPKDLKCGSTLFGNRFNRCNQCCHGSRSDRGWTYTDHFCT